MKRLLLLLLSVSLTAISHLHAADDSAAVDEGLLQKPLASLDKAHPWLPSITGYIQMYASYQTDDDSNTLNLKRVMVYAQGSPASWLGYRLQVNLAGTPKIYDVSIDFHAGRYANFSVGQFKTPIALENQISPKTLEMINCTQAVRHLAGFQDESGYNNAGRDIGAMFYGSAFKVGHEGGEHDLLKYTVGVFNGAELNRADDNKYKDISGRIDIIPIQGLTVSCSGYLGRMSDVLDSVSNVMKRMDRNRIAFGLEWKHSEWMLRTEYLSGKTGSLKSDGWYVLGGYCPCRKWQLYAQYDAYRHDRTATSAVMNYCSLGAKYVPLPYFFVNLNYSYRFQSDHPSTGNYHYAEVMCSVLL
ncbi:MAG: hypothetical protein IJ680_00510 [Paludibacteraceae bacterium]|nr:hypothetical protein [Paludibacteraceae bacterium]